MWAPLEGDGVLPGLASSSRAALCLANPTPGYFWNNWLAGLQKCLGLVFGGDRNLQVVSTGRAWRGAGAGGGSAAWPGRQVPCRGRAGLDGALCTMVQGLSRGCKLLHPRSPREGETTRQHVPKPPGRGAELRAGNGTAAGRMEVAGSELFSACPCESRICRPPFGEAFPGRQPGPRSSLLGAAQGGRVGRAWPPTLSPSPFLCTQCTLVGQPRLPPLSATPLLLIPGLYERSGEGKD